MLTKKDVFVAQVATVVAEFEASLAPQEWSMRHDLKRMRDADGTVYEVLALTLFKGPTRLLLDPSGYDIPGADGVMDLYLLPPYDPVATLYFEGEEWFIHSPFPPSGDAIAPPSEWTRSPLSQDSICHVVESIARDAVPSV